VLGALLLLLVACALGLVVVWRGALSRFEAIGLGLFIVVVACVGVGGALSLALRDDVVGDGRALIGCAVGPLLALVWRGALSGRVGGVLIGVASTVLLVLGLAGQSLAIVPVAAAPMVVASSLVMALVASLAAAVHAWRLGRGQPSRLLRARPRGEAAGALAFGLASLSALLTLSGDHSWGLTRLWPALCALGVVLLVQARAARVPLLARDGAIVLVGAGLFLVALPVPQALFAAVVAAVGLGLGGALEPLLVRMTAATSAASTMAPTSTSTSISTSTALALPEPGAVAGVGGLPPLLDDAIQRRPLRPRILSRTSARRLVEAAVDRAWRSQPHVASSKRRAPVDVQGGDDADVDGDAAELAEALCAIVDNALRHQASRTDTSDGRVNVVVRAAAQTVSFEVDDAGGHADRPAGSWRPFLDVVADANGERPGYGVSLSRARLLVERHGGQLHVRSGDEGGVQITVPRRVSRGPIGIA